MYNNKMYNLSIYWKLPRLTYRYALEIAMKFAQQNLKHLVNMKFGTIDTF